PWKRGLSGGVLLGSIHVSGTFSPSRIIAQYAACFCMASNVNGLLSRCTRFIRVTFFNHSRGMSYHHASRSMTSEYLGTARRLNGSMVTRSVVNRCVSPSTWMDASNRRNSASKAPGQSSSTPRRRPMRCVPAMLALSYTPSSTAGSTATVAIRAVFQRGLELQGALEGRPHRVAHHGAQTTLLQLVQRLCGGASGRRDHVPQLSHVPPACQCERRRPLHRVEHELARHVPRKAEVHRGVGE